MTSIQKPAKSPFPVRYTGISLPRKYPEGPNSVSSLSTAKKKALPNPLVHEDYKEFARDAIDTTLQTAGRFRENPNASQISFELLGNFPQDVMNNRLPSPLTEDVKDIQGRVIQGMKDHINLIPVSMTDKIISDVMGGQPVERNDVTVHYDLGALRKMVSHARKNGLLGMNHLDSERFMSTDNVYNMLDRLIDNCDAKKTDYVDPKKDKYVANTGFAYDILHPLIMGMALPLLAGATPTLNIDRIRGLHVHDDDAVPDIFENKEYHTRDNQEVMSFQTSDNPVAVSLTNECDAVYPNGCHPNRVQAGREILSSLIMYDTAIREGVASVPDIFRLQSVRNDPEKAKILREFKPEDFKSDKKLKDFTVVTDAFYELNTLLRKNTLLDGHSSQEAKKQGTNQSKIRYDVRQTQRSWAD